MGLMITLGLGLHTPATAQVPDNDLVATLAPFPLDTVFFDSGAARGVNQTSIPLSGELRTGKGLAAPDGSVVRARLVRANTQLPVTEWQDIATTSGGNWSGLLTLGQRSSHRLHVQVGSPGSGTQTTGGQDIVIGHIIVLIGQSEEAYMLSPVTDTTLLQALRPTVMDEDALRVVTYRSGGEYPGTSYDTNGILPVTNDTMYHSALGYMSNFFAQNAPGERFLLIDAAVSGTSYRNLASDALAVSNNEATDRTWVESFAGGVRMLRAYGTEPGMLMSTWTAAPATTSDGYRLRLYPLYTGRYAQEQGGAAYVLGQDAINNRPYDYLFYDLTGQGRGELDPAKTMAYFYGPHRFENSELTATKQDTRVSIRNFVDDGLSHILPFAGPEILSYESGFQAIGSSYELTRAAAMNWIDYAHPSKFSEDGSPRRAQYTALAALYGLGIGPDAAQSHDVPEFNQAYWEPAGAYAEFWYEDSDGATPAITTTRLARGVDAIPRTLSGTGAGAETDIAGADLPHRAEVAGFEIDGAAAETVTIEAGRVRVYPNSGIFTGNTRIDFGRGGASGIHTVSGIEIDDVIQADLFDKIWMNLPIATGMVLGVEGIPLRPLPDQIEIGSSLPAAPKFTVSENTAIYDSRNWGATTPITVRFRLTANPLSNAEVGLLRLPVGGSELKLSLISGRGLRYSFGPAGLAGNIVSPLPYGGVMREFVITADPTTGSFGLYVDGTEVVSQATGTTGTWSGSYGLRLLGLSSGAGMVSAGVESIMIWEAFTADGSAPAATPYKVISGDAETALAAAKSGPNPFTWYQGGGAL
ncbi:hypothetical protein [Pseudoruegeria sp. SK021]|uniref:hypothetical protein n=1 Tax=Pseudoruegeria sp. SK021 TaxID=1933035 RepID=UPI000A232469|nr:hypothetical protein [Pseudoruegeria sp. SK021]OSP54071.1 hypothetical protein BV911_14370 [Pseudoruegeria sp. SK021]